MRLGVKAAILCAFFFLHAPDIRAADTKAEIRTNLLLLPGSRAANERLSSTASVACNNSSLRFIMEQYSSRFQISYWIDRRVDADAPLQLMLPSAPLTECFQRLAAQCDAEVGLVENILLIAPRGKLAPIQVAAIRLHDQLSNQQTSSSTAKLVPIQWDMLTTPDELRKSIAKAWSTPLPKEFPHDLMNGGALPPCTLATQCSLLYGGFDRALELDASGKLLVRPLNNRSTFTANYPSSTFLPTLVKAAQASYPTLTVVTEGNSTTVTGQPNAHNRLLNRIDDVDRRGSTSRSNSPRSNPSSKSASSKALDAQRLDFELQNQTVGAALEHLAQNLKFELQWADSIADSDKEKRVSLKSKALSLNEVLAKLSAASGLKIRRSGTLVEVSK